MFSEEFLTQINIHALSLQSVAILGAKFDAEKQELAEAKEPWDELPDVTYYAACLLSRLEYELKQFSQKYGVSMAELEAAAKAKYSRRAAGEPKNINAEREAILAAVAKVEK